MDKYYFNAWNRGIAFLESLHEDQLIEEFFLRYADAAKHDIQLLVDSAFPHLLINGTRQGKQIKVTIDETILRVYASVTPHESHYEIVISLGAILAIDDASAALIHKLHPDEKCLWCRSDEFARVEPRFYDYSFLLTNVEPGGSKNFIYPYHTIFESNDMTEMFIITANFSILWLMLHEIGHIQLGHLNDLSEDNTAKQLDDSFLSRDDVEHLNTRLCQEFTADIYASNILYSTFLREEAVNSVFPKLVNSGGQAVSFLMLASVIPPLLLHRTQSSALRGGQELLHEYPDPKVRLFNALAVVTPAVDNNHKIFAYLAKAAKTPYHPYKLGIESLVYPYIRIIWASDIFLQLISSIPLFPWKIKKEINISDESVYANNLYGKVDHSLTVKTETEIISAALLSCRAYAEFKTSEPLKQMYETWLSIMRKSDSKWNSKQIESTPSLEEILRLLLSQKNFDPYEYTTLAYLYEVSKSASQQEILKEKFIYENLVNTINKTRDLLLNY